MKPWVRPTAWLVLWATLAVALVVGAFLAWLLSEGMPPGTVITVDGERFVVPAFSHFGHWFTAVIGVLILSAVLVVVVPLVLVLAMVVPMIVGGLGVALAVGVVALLLWPVVLLARWLWKERNKATTIRA